MSQTNWIWAALIAVALIAIGGYFVKPSSPSALGSVEGTTHYGSLSLSGTMTSSGLITGSAGETLTTSNTATSTLKVGCIQEYATSTATPIHFEISTTTSLATYTGEPATNVHGVSWTYGACPV